MSSIRIIALEYQTTVFAGFGFDTNISQAANQAFASAQTILKDLEEFNAAYANKYFFHEFEVGIGIHAGNVFTGNIGIGVNNNLTVMGLPSTSPRGFRL